jgi:hypothetical protein
MDEGSEPAIRRRLSDELKIYIDELRDGKLDKFEIQNDSFETIKVQLIALGLMKKSEKKHAASNTSVYWSITPYGEQYLMRLRAIRKDAIEK